MSIGTGNLLQAIREEAGIQRAELASASRISERVVKRIEEIDGAPRLEIKARIVAGLNSLLPKQEAHRVEDVFAGWQVHRRHTKRTSRSGPTTS